jgi:hypothetical protein
MLLKKKFLLLMVLFLLLFSTVSYAQVCEVSKIKEVLRKILYLYFTDPKSSPLTLNEVKDMLVFYLSISSQNLTVDCSAVGTTSNRPIYDVVSVGDTVTDTIPSCADATKYGECSKSRPAYCYAGVLYAKCDLCGCPSNSVCGKSGKCETIAQNITCFKDIDCGQSTFIGDYYCTNNYIIKDYVNYSCLNPETADSKCVSSKAAILLEYCNPSLNQTCTAGQSTCQIIVNATGATTSNQTNQTPASNVTITSSDGTWCYDPDGYGSVDIYSKKYCMDNSGTHYDYCESPSLLLTCQ